MTRSSGPRARVIAAAMQKGGVGKSTTVLNTSRAAAQRGLRVLVVDMDPQGNVTDALTSEDLPEQSISIADAILPDSALPPGAEPTRLREVVVPTIWSGVDLAPMTHSDALSRAENLIQASEEGREHRLAEALQPVLGEYDMVLIDNAPSLGLLVANALAASDAVLVVMRAERWSAQGLVRLRRAIERVQRYTNPQLTWAGVLISKWRHTADERSKLADIAAHFPDAEVWASANDISTVIPEWVDIMRLINEGRGLDEASSEQLRKLAETYDWIVSQLLREQEVTA